MKSFKFRTIILILLSTILSVALVGGLSIWTAIRIVNQNSVQHLKLLCDTNAQKIDSVISSVEQATNILSEYVDYFLGDFSQFKNDSGYVRDYTYGIESIAETFAENTPESVSVYVRYNHIFTGPTSGILLVKSEATGSFEKRTPMDLSKYSPKDAEHVGWYYEPINAGKPIWTAPYYDTSYCGRVISYVVPLFVEDEFFCVVGMDIDFDHITNMVNSISAYSSGYAFVIQDGKILIHNEVVFNTPIDEEHGFGTLAQVVTDFDENAVRQYVFDGQAKSMSASVLKNGMMLVLAAPTEEIFTDSTRLTAEIAAIAVVSLVIVTFVSYFVISRTLRIATTDELTRLYNRKYFVDKYGNSKDIPDGQSLFIFDIDNFKHINDHYGHNTGDSVLRRIAAVAKTIIGKNGVIARWGGDEFIGLVKSDIAKDVMVSILKRVETDEREAYGKISVSIGLTDADKSKSFHEITEKADDALYLSKSNGRNRLTVL